VRQLIKTHNDVICENLTTFYQAELAVLIRISDGFDEDRDQVEVTEVSHEGFVVCVAGYRAQFVEFGQHALTKRNFVQEFVDALSNETKQTEYHEMKRIRQKFKGFEKERSLVVVKGKSKRSPRKHRKTHATTDDAEAKVNDEPSSPSATFGPVHDLLLSNKEALKLKDVKLFVADRGDVLRGHEQIVIVPRKMLSLKLICKRASMKFRLSGKANFKHAFFRDGSEILTSDHLSGLQSGARIFMCSARNANKKLPQTAAALLATAVAPTSAVEPPRAVAVTIQ